MYVDGVAYEIPWNEFHSRNKTKNNNERQSNAESTENRYKYTQIISQNGPFTVFCWP